MSIQYIIAVLIGLAVLLAVLGLGNLFRTRKKALVSKRLQEIREGREAETEPTITYITDRQQSWLPKIVQLFGFLLPHVLASESLQWDLVQAGYRRIEARHLYAGSKVLLAILLGLGTYLAGSYFGIFQRKLLLVSIGAAVLGYFIPNLWIARRRAKRREEITLALPDALDLMVVCVEAGQGLNAALLNVGREMYRQSPALSDEFRLINHEIRVGLSRARALRNFSFRTGVDEARALSAVLIQSDRLGTSIANALRVHAGSMRVRRRQRAEEAARKTPVKLVFPLVLFIFPELLVVILAPALLQLVRVLSDSAKG
jgi:tight adherence protein C